MATMAPLYYDAKTKQKTNQDKLIKNWLKTNCKDLDAKAKELGKTYMCGPCAQKEPPKKEERADDYKAEFFDPDVIWLPECFQTELKLLQEAKDQKTAIYDGVKFLKSKEMKKRIVDNDYSPQLGMAMALTVVMCKDLAWASDIKTSPAVIKNMGNFWNKSLLGKKDGRIGLGAGEEDEASRQGLYKWLGWKEPDLAIGDGASKKKGKKKKSAEEDEDDAPKFAHFPWQPKERKKRNKSRTLSGMSNDEEAQ